MSTFYAPTSELYHYGRLGMKWGEHRFAKKQERLNKKAKRVIQDLNDQSDSHAMLVSQRTKKSQQQWQKEDLRNARFVSGVSKGMLAASAVSTVMTLGITAPHTALSAYIAKQTSKSVKILKDKDYEKQEHRKRIEKGEKWLKDNGFSFKKESYRKNLRYQHYTNNVKDLDRTYTNLKTKRYTLKDSSK